MITVKDITCLSPIAFINRTRYILQLCQYQVPTTLTTVITLKRATFNCIVQRSHKQSATFRQTSTRKRWHIENHQKRDIKLQYESLARWKKHRRQTPKCWVVLIVLRSLKIGKPWCRFFGGYFEKKLQPKSRCELCCDTGKWKMFNRWVGTSVQSIGTLS